MSNYLNLEKPQENDLLWGNKINSNFDKIDAEANRVNNELGTKANNNHTHNFNNLYAPIQHSHDDLYTKIGHTHSEIVTLTSRITTAESRINTLFSDKADKSYVINLLQNFDHSITGLTPVIHLNGQGSNSQNLRVNCWINSPAFLLEWHLSFLYSGLQNYANRGPQNTSEFSIAKPGVNAPYWGGNNITGITIKVKCRNPFLANNWSNEATLTDNEIYMFNFIDADKIIAALVCNSNFQNTIASTIITNPGLTDLIASKVTNNNHQSSAN